MKAVGSMLLETVDTVDRVPGVGVSTSVGEYGGGVVGHEIARFEGWLVEEAETKSAPSMTAKT
jgi:hypothetical protein